MPSADLYGTAYGNFAADTYAQVRRETYGEDLGQSSWCIGHDFRRFFQLLNLKPADHVLDVGCGSGGPALLLAREFGCHVSGIDINASGIKAGMALALEANLQEKVHFQEADIRQPLPFSDQSFDALLSIDAICHFPNRRRLFDDWRRVLRPGGRLLYTDPVVVTGLVAKEEFAIRASTGYFEFGPPGTNERLLAESGFELLSTDDITAAEAEISHRWHAARQRHAAELISLEGDQTFAALQDFLAAVHRLTTDRRLSRFLFLSQKPNHH
jgi:SAM-dependent methyltransferase